jgi:hypothetical protein
MRIPAIREMSGLRLFERFKIFSYSLLAHSPPPPQRDATNEKQMLDFTQAHEGLL